MRIIGGHDYYDSGMAYGRDDTVLFLRTGDRRMNGEELGTVLRPTRSYCSATFTDGEVEGKRGRYRSPHPYARHGFEEVRSGELSHTVRAGAVVLCGTLRNGVRVDARWTTTRMQPQHEPRWIWSADAFRAYAQEHGLGVDEGRDGTAEEWTEIDSRRMRTDVRIMTLDRWFEPVAITGGARAALVADRITIASFDPGLHQMRDADGVVRDWLIDQPTLGAMDFAKAVGPYEAYQELSMWFGGVLPSNGPPMVEITDNAIKIAKHGFHHPTSFRRAKTAR